MVQAIEWKSDHVKIIDQTELPIRTVYSEITTIEQIFEAIQKLRVRGAPLIGISAAYGLYLGMRDVQAASPDDFFVELDKKIDYLSKSRPTAVNLFWALQRIKDQLQAVTDQSTNDLKERLLRLAIELHEDDFQRCKQMGEHGLEVIPDGARILTHCNTGALATGGIGTALGVIYTAHQAGKNITVYADETRPLLQGARLTMWELMQAGIPSKLLCDNMAASLMQQKMVDLVILGSDRIAANGAVANKIGTYGVAILAKHHNVPFYVAAPLSTVDLDAASGDDIPIENRASHEVSKVFQQCQIAPDDADCWNPAFDVTPPDLVTGIITEKGILYPPYTENIRNAFDK